MPKHIDRTEPLHLLVDSTGLKIYGEGEWLDQKHGIRSHRCWRKLHLGMNADTHELVAVELTPDDVGYNRRSLIEIAMFRYKIVVGRRLHARTLPNQRTEARIGCNILNRMTGLGMPASGRVH